MRGCFRICVHTCVAGCGRRRLRKPPIDGQTQHDGTGAGNSSPATAEAKYGLAGADGVRVGLDLRLTGEVGEGGQAEEGGGAWGRWDDSSQARAYGRLR